MKKITGSFILLVIGVVATYDLYALSQGGGSATISSVIISVSKDFLIIPFLFGVLVGHLFWRMDSNEDVG